MKTLVPNCQLESILFLKFLIKISEHNLNTRIMLRGFYRKPALTLSSNSLSPQLGHAHSEQQHHINDLSFCFCGEGPRSRRYGRTAALRLIVQLCDEYG
jgi:hypothetical protein